LQKNKVEKRVYETEYPANNPIEDRKAIDNLSNVDGFVATVFDGHGGYQCCKFLPGF
jgi:serine/threonine protein phosphatase PrpC